MLFLVTKASNYDWYDFIETDSIKELIERCGQEDAIIIGKKPVLLNSEYAQYWEGFKAEDAPKFDEAKYRVLIYDDYIE